MTRRCADRFGESVRVGGAPPVRVLLGDATMNEFAWTLTNLVRGTGAEPPIVVNETGLAGRYDVDLEYDTRESLPDFTTTRDMQPGRDVVPILVPEPAAGRPRPDQPPPSSSPQGDKPLLNALERQLGLTIQQRKMPLDVLRIDAVSFPVLN
jgi:uncharacterized protein (TIGR03435 family)